MSDTVIVIVKSTRIIEINIPNKRITLFDGPNEVAAVDWEAALKLDWTAKQFEKGVIESPKEVNGVALVGYTKKSHKKSGSKKGPDKKFTEFGS